MSDDIVERLQRAAAENAEDGLLMHQAAAEIERLRSAKFIETRLDMILAELAVIHERIRKLGI